MAEYTASVSLVLNIILAVFLWRTMQERNYWRKSAKLWRTDYDTWRNRFFADRGHNDRV